MKCKCGEKLSIHTKDKRHWIECPACGYYFGCWHSYCEKPPNNIGGLYTNKRTLEKECREELKILYKQHPRFDEITCVIGCFDGHDAIHSVIKYEDSDLDNTHAGNLKHVGYRCKEWRYWSHSGIDESVLNRVPMDSEDWERVRQYLIRQGIFEVYQYQNWMNS